MKIKINELKLFGHHGVYDEEKNNGQDFYISVSIKIKVTPIDDDIKTTIDYSWVIEIIKEIFRPWC